MFSSILRYLTLTLLVGRGLYWYTTGRAVKKEKPSLKKSFSLQSKLGWIFSGILEGIIFLQLLGIVSFLPIVDVSQFFIFSGFLMCGIGVGICFVARHELCVNWSHAADYE